MSVIKEVVRNILIYYILVTVIMSLIGNSSFKKYINTFTGFVLILTVLTPLFKYLKIDGALDLNIQKNNLYEVTAEESGDIALAELSQKDAIVEAYKSSLETQVQSTLKKNNYEAEEMELEIDEDLESDTFGQVQSIEAVCVVSDGTKEEETVDAVEAVDIPDVTIQEKGEVTKKIEDTEETKEVREALADEYGIEADQISIEVKEEDESEQ